MRIQVRCICKKTLILAPKWVGKTIRCPFCHEKLTISPSVLTQSAGIVVDRPATAVHPAASTSPPPEPKPEPAPPSEPAQQAAVKPGQTLDMEVEFDFGAASSGSSSAETDGAEQELEIEAPQSTSPEAQGQEVELEVEASPPAPTQEGPSAGATPPEMDLEIEEPQTAPSAEAEAVSQNVDIPTETSDGGDIGDLEIEFADPSADEQALDEALIPDVPCGNDDVLLAGGEAAEGVASVEGILVEEQAEESETSTAGEAPSEDAAPQPSTESSKAPSGKKKRLLGKLFGKKK